MSTALVILAVVIVYKPANLSREDAGDVDLVLPFVPREGEAEVSDPRRLPVAERPGPSEHHLRAAGARIRLRHHKRLLPPVMLADECAVRFGFTPRTGRCFIKTRKETESAWRGLGRIVALTVVAAGLADFRCGLAP